MHLKENLISKALPSISGAEYIDVRFFEASTGLDDKTKLIVNEKIASMAL
jgi:hypothetical protein